MSLNVFGHRPIDYFPCRYGASQLIFRGPRRRISGRYAVYLGGIETFGKFVEVPFPAELEFRTGLKSVNLGCPNIGPGAILNDPELMKIIQGSSVAVIELLGAQNASNPFYEVHPRRNDRFIRANAPLREALPQLDFVDYSFNRHLLSSVQRAAPEVYADVKATLGQLWLGQVSRLIEAVEAPVILLWLSDRPMDADRDDTEPLLVDPHLLAQLPQVHGLVEVVASPEDRAKGLEQMYYDEFERPAAERMLGAVAHRRATEALVPILQGLS